MASSGSSGGRAAPTLRLRSTSSKDWRRSLRARWWRRSRRGPPDCAQLLSGLATCPDGFALRVSSGASNDLARVATGADVHPGQVMTSVGSVALGPPPVRVVPEQHEPAEDRRLPGPVVHRRLGELQLPVLP